MCLNEKVLPDLRKDLFYFDSARAGHESSVPHCIRLQQHIHIIFDNSVTDMFLNGDILNLAQSNGVNFQKARKK